MRYNLFRRKQERDFYCAVPEDYVVPAFLRPESWEFERRTDATADGRPCFDPKTAASGVRLNGFYLFLPVRQH